MSEENALMRSIRLKRPDDAVYWASRLREDGYTPQRVARRLFQCALRDNLRIDLMLAAEGMLAESAQPDSKVNLNRLAAQLACSEKLWSCSIGRKLVTIIATVQRQRTFHAYTDAELILRLESAMNDEKQFLDAMSIAKEIWTRFKGGVDIGEFIALLREQVKGTEATPVVELLNRCLGSVSQVTIAEETLFYLAIAWAVGGLWGQTINEVDEEGIYGRVAGRLRQRETVPGWASAGDRRFEASCDGYANMAGMYEREQRLIPDDAGVLFHARDGQWLAIVKEESGLYLVQSEANPHRYYEVNLAILSCTCDDFIRRRRSCKHVAAAREHLGDQLPFRVLDEKMYAS